MKFAFVLIIALLLCNPRRLLGQSINPQDLNIEIPDFYPPSPPPLHELNWRILPADEEKASLLEGRDHEEALFFQGNVQTQAPYSLRGQATWYWKNGKPRKQVFYQDGIIIREEKSWTEEGLELNLPLWFIEQFWEEVGSHHGIPHDNSDSSARTVFFMAQAADQQDLDVADTVLMISMDVSAYAKSYPTWAYAQNRLARRYAFSGRLVEARRRYHLADEIFISVGHRGGHHFALQTLAHIEHFEENYAVADSLYEIIHLFFEEVGDSARSKHALLHRAELALKLDQPEDAGKFIASWEEWGAISTNSTDSVRYCIAKAEYYMEVEDYSRAHYWWAQAADTEAYRIIPRFHTRVNSNLAIVSSLEAFSRDPEDAAQFIDTNDPLGTNTGGPSYHNIYYGLLTDAGDLEASHQRTIKLSNEFLKRGNHDQYAHCQKTLCYHLITWGKWEDALRLIDTTVQRLESCGHRHPTYQFTYLEGIAYMGLGDHFKASQLFSKYQYWIEENGVDDFEVLMLKGIGGIGMIRSGKFNKARILSREAIVLLQNRLESKLTDGSRKMELYSLRSLFPLYLFCAIQLKDSEGIFELSEFIKEHLQLNAIRKQEMESQKIWGNYSGKINDLLDQQAILESQLAAEKQAEKRKELLEERRQNRATIKRLIQFSREESFRSGVHPLPQPATTEQMQTVLKEGETLISYSIGSGLGFAFIISKSDQELVFLGPMDSAQQHVDRLWNGYVEPAKAALTKNDLRKSQRAHAVYAGTSRALYQALWEPLTHHPALKNKTIYIVPDAFTARVPFSLLQKKAQVKPWNKYDYLGRKHTFSYLPTATLLYEVRTNAPPPHNYQNQFLGLLGYSPDIGACNLGQGPFNPVVIDSDERDQVTALFGSRETQLYTNQAASEAKLKDSDAPHYRFIHLFSHGEINMDYPEETKIHLAPEAGEDGCLEQHEIMQLRLNAELVTLGACETGRIIGDPNLNASIMSLSNAFFYAGAKATVTSLWQVVQGPTQDFFQAYYQKLALENPEDKAQALQTVKRRMMDDPQLANPYYWAPFIYVGLR